MRAVAAIAIAFLLVGPVSLAAQQEEGEPQDGQLLDRIVAVVDDDPILESDIERVIGVGLVSAEEEETDEELERRALDLLIEQKLRFHEMDRFGFSELPLDEVEAQYEALRESFRSEREFLARLDELGITEDELRQLVARQLMVLTFVEERLGPRVFVTLDDIRLYYSEVFVAELEERQMEVPPIEEVREDIRALIRERRLNRELEVWTEELRLEADVEDYLESEHADEPPPPLVGRKEEGRTED